MFSSTRSVAVVVLLAASSAWAGRITAVTGGTSVSLPASPALNNDSPAAHNANRTRWNIALDPGGERLVTIQVSPSGGITEYQIRTFVTTGWHGPVQRFQVDLLGPAGADLNFDTDDGDPALTRSFSSLNPASIAPRSLAWTGLAISETEFLTFAVDIPDFGADPYSYQLHYRLSVPEPAAGITASALGLVIATRRKARQSLSNHA